VCETQQKAELWCTDISQLGYYPIYISFGHKNVPTFMALPFFTSLLRYDTMLTD